jgi:hypothetical protein
LPSWPDLPVVDEGPARRWAELLDGFERELARAEHLAGDAAPDAGEPQPAPWLPPEGLGALPESERERAIGILAAQRAAMARLEGLRAELARHIDVAKAATARPTDAAAYLDRIA